MGIKISEIEDRAACAAVNAAVARYKYPESKRNCQSPLVRQNEVAPGMVNIVGPLLVRIVRINKRFYDDDNFVAGCKQLRDAIAAAFSRKGDSAKDGLRFEYTQEIGEPEMRIEIYAD